LRHTGGFTNSIVENIAKDTGRNSFLAVLAGSAGELKTMCFWIFLRIQHVRAFTAKAEGNLFEVLLWLFTCAGGGRRHRADPKASCCLQVKAV